MQWQFTMRRRRSPSSSNTPSSLNDALPPPSTEKVKSEDDERLSRHRLSLPPCDTDVTYLNTTKYDLGRDILVDVKDNAKKPWKSAITFYVAKFVILRLLALVYLVAFLGAFYQNRGLMGAHGLQPASYHMERLRNTAPNDSHLQLLRGFLSHPTIFWWIDITDGRQDILAGVGALLSSFVLLGIDSWLLQLMLWILYFSIVTISGGTSFYSYGWESQILETGFLAIFLCDLPQIVNAERRWSIQAIWKDNNSNYYLDRESTSSQGKSSPSLATLWLFRWLCFRISIGAGLIKIRGSSCWANKTCLWYHFETQPIPSPISFVFHFLPKWMLTKAVDLDLIVQLYTSWFVLVPQLSGAGRHLKSTTTIIRRTGGFLQAGFMVNIILSGNFAFLNHLTIIPALACLDDVCWPKVLQRYAVPPRTTGAIKAQPKTRKRYFVIPPRSFVDMALVFLILLLSQPVITNLLQWDNNGRQVMNASFDAFRLVNTYGAFGSVGEARYEAIVSISNNQEQWTELEFPCKPGNVKRRPCFCAPYHYRLDWNIWFLGFKPHKAYLQKRETWLYTLIQKIMIPGSSHDERPWLSLLEPSTAEMLSTAYSSNSPPKYAKVDMYRYAMAAPLWDILLDLLNGKNIVWWNRTYEENLIPSVELDPATKTLRIAQ